MLPGLTRGDRSRVEIAQLPYGQWHPGRGQPFHAPAGHGQGVLQTRLPSRRGPVLGLEASSRIGGARKAPASSSRRCRSSVSCLELPRVVLVDAEAGRRLRLHVLRRHRDRLVRPGVVSATSSTWSPQPPPCRATLPVRSFLRVWMARSTTAVAFRSQILLPGSAPELVPQIHTSVTTSPCLFGPLVFWA